MLGAIREQRIDGEAKRSGDLIETERRDSDPGRLPRVDGLVPNADRGRQLRHGYLGINASSLHCLSQSWLK
jgi:hypothetical protein